jgi:hypothetical protein
MATVRNIRLAVSLIVLAGLSGLAPSGTAQTGRLRKYETKYYTLYSDLDIETVREAALRLTRMADDYRQRTRGLGTIRTRLPFWLFARQIDYLAAGSMPGSGGQYSGDRLMAVYRGVGYWSTLQHEGFHQFVHRAIGGKMPVWLNEGMAEYFGHAEWTGDDFVAGIFPRSLQQRLARRIQAGQLLSFRSMLSMTYAQWSARLDRGNYDQAWAMVHFLVHAEAGKYKDSIVKLVNDIADGRDPVEAFKARVTRDIDGFEKAFSQWVLSRPAQAALETERQVVLQTLTSYLARAQLLRLDMPDVEAFFAHGQAGRIAIDLKTDRHHWLPQGLLRDALKKARTMKTWKLQGQGLARQLVLELPDGTQMVGSFVLGPKSVEVKTKTVPPPATAEASR